MTMRDRNVAYNPRIILLGGASSCGKTTLCTMLTEDFGIPNLRLHRYILGHAKREGIDPVANWDNISPIAMRALLKDCALEGTVVSDKHFAIQPIWDTAYALGLDIAEDIEEPYVKGFIDSSLQIPEFLGVDVRMVLIDTESNQLLERRRRIINTKKPRSLDKLSIQREREFERRYFLEAAKILGVSASATTLMNEEGKLDSVYDQLKYHCDL